MVEGVPPLPGSLLLPCTNSGVLTCSLQETRQKASLLGKGNALETRRQSKGSQRHKQVSTAMGAFTEHLPCALNSGEQGHCGGLVFTGVFS